MSTAARPTSIGAVADFGFTIGGSRYRVTVRRDLQRGGYSAKLTARGGYSAKLSADSVGTIMDPNGTSPSDALTRLARELWTGDATDRKIAKEIARYAWFPLKLS